MSLFAQTAVRSVALLALGCVTFALGACSGAAEPLYPVSGTVLHNGKPAAGAIVTFHPEGKTAGDAPTSTGVTGSDGSFTLSTGNGKGAKPGKYIVTVMWPDTGKNASEKPGLKMKSMEVKSSFDAPDAFGGRYMSREKSKLTAEVKAGENKLDPFDLK